MNNLSYEGNRSSNIGGKWLAGDGCILCVHVTYCSHSQKRLRSFLSLRMPSHRTSSDELHLCTWLPGLNLVRETFCLLVLIVFFSLYDTHRTQELGITKALY